MKEGKDIDKLFKDGLENPDLPFNDLDWDNLEERLHPTPKRRIVPLIWLTAVAGIAAMLLVVFLLAKPSDNEKEVKAVIKKDQRKQNSNKPENNTDNLTEVPTKQNDSTGNGDLSPLVLNAKSIADTNKQEHAIGYGHKTIQKVAGTTDVKSNILANVGYKPELNSKTDLVTFKDQDLTTTIAVGKPEQIKALVLKKKSRFVLSILAAPDLTSVQKSGTSSLSGSFGVEATYAVTKRISITTGAAYAKKIYDSDFSLYKPNSTYVFNVTPSNIHANCDVIDIPINVNYKVFDGRRNSISVSIGLSSYLMLKEKYSYSYNGAYQGPQNYEVRNQNQHYLGIANVGVEFQHKINNNLSISAKPFMKIPLTDIGYGNARLSSTGVAVSVNMNLFGKKN
ncbi:hypothetical protein HDC90_004639 [Pedobacter sp. AK013]|uniref:hypothetical protein n=1 Tax=Pedobacter sp. AK013 TaxID=2723071 RepID=UPI001614DC12|nr:hypothetical protein [Pedobacter sp. AK013]MBB6239977.1 hypothetical protein [Pedobacter sp. AK013]